MKRGRPRRHDPTIPQHIDQHALPKGAYWDRVDRCWYTIRAGKRKNLVRADATLADLHAAIEKLGQADRGSLGFVMDQFHESARFQKLAEATRADYEWCRTIARTLKTRAGIVADLQVARVTTAVVQAIVDHIEKQGTPAKANHLLRYLRRTLAWGIRRGLCSTNPARGVEQANERRARVVPAVDSMQRMIEFARQRGAFTAHRKGAVAAYLWIVMELAYLCRLRGIEVVTLTEAQADERGIRTKRRKGSNDNHVLWTPRLRTAWDAAIALRDGIWREHRSAIPLRVADRPVFVNQEGAPLQRRALTSAWKRMMVAAKDVGVIAEGDEFGSHALKHRGITDTKGTRGEKQLASGHKSEAMLDTYDHDVPEVLPSGAHLSVPGTKKPT